MILCGNTNVSVPIKSSVDSDESSTDDLIAHAAPFEALVRKPYKKAIRAQLSSSEFNFSMSAFSSSMTKISERAKYGWLQHVMDSGEQQALSKELPELRESEISRRSISKDVASLRLQNTASGGSATPTVNTLTTLELLRRALSETEKTIQTIILQQSHKIMFVFGVVQK